MSLKLKTELHLKFDFYQVTTKMHGFSYSMGDPTSVGIRENYKFENLSSVD